MNKILLCTISVLAITYASGEARVKDENRERILSELQESFQEDFLTHWYPAVKDEENGGYWSDFDANWKRTGRQDKFVVSQARHLWVTSEVALFAHDPMYRELADHGFLYLKEKMWDAKRGGFYSLLSKTGKPDESWGKSSYGNSFAIYGLASYYKLTQSQEALDLLKETFQWLEERSWDPEYGGYVDRMKVDGSWAGSRQGMVDTGPNQYVGVKDYNSSLHLLESLTALYQVWPDALVRRRLEEMLVLIRDKFTTEKGFLLLYFNRDWSHVSYKNRDRTFIKNNYYDDHVSWGHDVETAFLMLEASHALGIENDEKTSLVAKRMVDHALATGWDSEIGGLYDSGYYFKGEDACEVIRPEKTWWIAAEGLNAFLLFAELYPEQSKYWQAFEKQWEYIDRHLVDHERGGWYYFGVDSSPAQRERPKSEIWKASYHDGRAYMNCIKMLRGEFELTKHR